MSYPSIRPDPTATEPDAPADSKAGMEPLFEKDPLDQISLGQLREISLLTQVTSISAVAHRVGRSQSTVSRSLQQLQSRFPRFPLYQSDHTGVLVTQHGKQLAGIADTIWQQLRGFHEQANDQLRSIRIGGGAATLHSMVIPRLMEIRRLFEAGDRQCRLQLNNQKTLDTMEQLLTGELDFGILRPSAVRDVKLLECMHLGRIGYVLVVKESEARKHGLKSVSDFVRTRYPVLTLANEGEFKRELRLRLRENQIDLMLTDEFDFFRDILVGVRHNPVAGIVPRTELFHEPDKSSFRVIELPFMGVEEYAREFVLCYNPGHLVSRQIDQTQVKDLAAVFSQQLQPPPTPPKKKGWLLRRTFAGDGD